MSEMCPSLRGNLLMRPRASRARSSESGQGQVGNSVEARMTSPWRGLGHIWKAESCRHAANSGDCRTLWSLGTVRMAIAAEALMACIRAMASSACGAIDGREAMMAMIERDQRH